MPLPRLDVRARRLAPRGAALRREPGFHKESSGSSPIAVDTWGPFVFVNPDPDAEPLAEALGELPAQVAELGLDVDSLGSSSVLGRTSTPPNWKMCSENFLECYHCQVAHPRLYGGRRRLGRRLHPRGEPPVLDPVRAGARGRKADFDPRGPIARGQFHFLWPNLTMNILPGRANLSIGPIVPRARATYRFLDYFFGPDVEHEWVEEMLAFDDQVGAEDRVLVEGVQRGSARRRRRARPADGRLGAPDRALPEPAPRRARLTRSRLSGLPAGRRAKWVVLAVWLLAAVALGPLQPRLQESTVNDPASFLPASAESREVLDVVDERFAAGRVTPAIVVWRREDGLTSADRSRIAAELDAIRSADLPDTLPPGALELAPDGRAALAAVPIAADDIDSIEPVVERLRELTGSKDGLESWVAGPAGITVDAVSVFSQIDVTLLLATSALILVLLLLLYRSPVIALVPLLVVAFAYVVAAAFVYALIEAGAITVNGQVTGILIILMFGAGTDYCLLLVARTREELRRTEDTHEALAEALRHTSPAILSSGGTVVAAMLVLLVADLESTRALGPVLALGIAVTVLAGLTLLPALLAILGRRSFWPAVPRPGTADDAGSPLWRRVGAMVARRPRVVAAATTGALIVAALGNVIVDLPGLSLGGGFRGEVEAIDGQAALAASFPAGEGATTDVLVATPRAKAATAALRGIPLVAAVRPGGTSDDGGLARLAVSLRADPYVDESVDVVPRLRDAARSADASALVGGPTAEEADTRAAARRDASLIVPLTLLAILAILIALLRALVAPVYLVATVVLSFAATLGLSLLAFQYVFDAPGSDPACPRSSSSSPSRSASTTTSS